MRFFAGLGCALSLSGCTPPEQPKPQPAAAPRALSEPAPPASPTADAPPASAPASSPAGSSGGDPLGQRFQDPDWYRLDLIPHKAVIQNGRSEARADGTFSSAMVLQLEADMNAERCAQHLGERVGAAGVTMGAAEKGADGRLTLRGETERYRVTLVCGEAKGVPTAYVGYEWKGQEG